MELFFFLKENWKGKREEREKEGIDFVCSFCRLISINWFCLGIYLFPFDFIHTYIFSYPSFRYSIMIDFLLPISS